MSSCQEGGPAEAVDLTIVIARHAGVGDGGLGVFTRVHGYVVVLRPVAEEPVILHTTHYNGTSGERPP